MRWGSRPGLSCGGDQTRARPAGEECSLSVLPTCQAPLHGHVLVLVGSVPPAHSGSLGERVQEELPDCVHVCVRVHVCVQREGERPRAGVPFWVPSPPVALFARYGSLPHCGEQRAGGPCGKLMKTRVSQRGPLTAGPRTCTVAGVAPELLAQTRGAQLLPSAASCEEPAPRGSVNPGPSLAEPHRLIFEGGSEVCRPAGGQRRGLVPHGAPHLQPAPRGHASRCRHSHGQGTRGTPSTAAASKAAGRLPEAPQGTRKRRPMPGCGWEARGAGPGVSPTCAPIAHASAKPRLCTCPAHARANSQAVHGRAKGVWSAGESPTRQ